MRVSNLMFIGPANIIKILDRIVFSFLIFIDSDNRMNNTQTVSHVVNWDITNDKIISIEIHFKQNGVTFIAHSVHRVAVDQNRLLQVIHTDLDPVRIGTDDRAGKLAFWRWLLDRRFGMFKIVDFFPVHTPFVLELCSRPPAACISLSKHYLDYTYIPSFSQGLFRVILISMSVTQIRVSSKFKVYRLSVQSK